MFVPPPFTWTGFYVGLNAGGIWSSGSRRRRFLTRIPTSAPASSLVDFPGGLGNGNAGFIGGGQAGYNWQTGAFVLGVETDFEGTTLSKTLITSAGPLQARSVRPAPGDFFSVNAKTSLIGSARHARASASSSRRTIA